MAILKTHLTLKFCEATTTMALATTVPATTVVETATKTTVAARSATEIRKTFRLLFEHAC